jgi:hypothetical protein
MSVDEVVARYDDEWILLRITEWDQDGWPSHGEVLAHSSDHDYIWDVTGKRPPDKASGEQHYIFQAHPTVRTGAEMMELLKTAWESDSFPDRRRW